MTLGQFLRKTGELERGEEKLPTAAVAKMGAFGIATLVAGSRQSGGVKASAAAFKFKPPRPTKGFAMGKIVGFGFATLDEHGSYKKPHGYDIEPQYGIGRGIYGKNRAILGSKARNFAAAYVHHPPIKAHPYADAAQIVIGKEFEKVADLEQVKLLVSVFR